MKSRLYPLLLIIFTSSCSDKKLNNNQKILELTIKNSVGIDQYIVEDISYHPAPSSFKNLELDFDYYQLTYFKNQDNSQSEIRYYYVNNGEIYRLGKGPDCIIFSREIRWNSKGDLILNFENWFENNSIENKLYFEKPKGSVNIYNPKQYTGSHLSDDIKKVICK